MLSSFRWTSGNEQLADPLPSAWKTAEQLTQQQPIEPAKPSHWLWLWPPLRSLLPRIVLHPLPLRDIPLPAFQLHPLISELPSVRQKHPKPPYKHGIQPPGSPEPPGSPMQQLLAIPVLLTATEAQPLHRLPSRRLLRSLRLYTLLLSHFQSQRSSGVFQDWPGFLKVGDLPSQWMSHTRCRSLGAQSWLLETFACSRLQLQTQPLILGAILQWPLSCPKYLPESQNPPVQERAQQFLRHADAWARPDTPSGSKHPSTVSPRWRTAKPNSELIPPQTAQPNTTRLCQNWGPGNTVCSLVIALGLQIPLYLDKAFCVHFTLFHGPLDPLTSICKRGNLSTQDSSFLSSNYGCDDLLVAMPVRKCLGQGHTSEVLL